MVLWTVIAAPSKSSKYEEYRIWADTSEKSRVEAKFVELARGTVTLKRKKGGELLKVKLARLRTEDQEFATLAQREITTAKAEEFRKTPPKPRDQAPAALLVSYKSIRMELGIYSSVEGRATELEKFLVEWLALPGLDQLGAEIVPHMRIEDRVELAMREADRLAPRLGEILDLQQQRQLTRLSHVALFPLVIRPSDLGYLHLPQVRKELNLTPKQVAELDLLEEESWLGDYESSWARVDRLFGREKKKSPGVREASAKTAVNPETAEANRLKEILSSEQRTRLAQIRLYFDPAGEILSKTNPAGKIRLDKAQRQALAKLRADLGREALEDYLQGPSNPKTLSPDEVSRSLWQSMHAQVMGMLGEQQRHAYQAMLGDTFDPWPTPGPLAIVPAFESAEEAAANGSGTKPQPQTEDDES